MARPTVLDVPSESISVPVLPPLVVTVGPGGFFRGDDDLAVNMIRLPDDWDDAINVEVAKQGVDKSAFFREAIKAALPAKVRAKLSEPRKRGQPRKEQPR